MSTIDGDHKQSVFAKYIDGPEKAPSSPPETLIKRSRRHADLRAFLAGILLHGPAPATLVEERGAAHGLQEPRSAFVFTSERGSPFTTAGFARMIERAGVEAKLGFQAHPHMLRHACGFALANQGHDTRSLQAYLGHKNIQHTVRYSELTPTRFKDFWRERDA